MISETRRRGWAELYDIQQTCRLCKVIFTSIKISSCEWQLMTKCANDQLTIFWFTPTICLCKIFDIQSLLVYTEFNSYRIIYRSRFVGRCSIFCIVCIYMKLCKLLFKFHNLALELKMSQLPFWLTRKHVIYSKNFTAENLTLKATF